MRGIGSDERWRADAEVLAIEGRMILTPHQATDVNELFELGEAHRRLGEVVAVRLVFVPRQPAPMPSTKRPPVRTCSVAAILAVSAGPVAGRGRGGTG